MINIGKFNTLKISTQTETATFLDGGDRDDIELNPNDIDKKLKTGHELSVFEYSDGKGKLLANTKTP
jgi:predicted RNA-binding protein (virulence factor B family)